MIIDRSLYGSRNFLDQHRDMRLDVDNMSYEVGKNIYKNGGFNEMRRMRLLCICLE